MAEGFSNKAKILFLGANTADRVRWASELSRSDVDVAFLDQFIKGSPSSCSICVVDLRKWTREHGVLRAELSADSPDAVVLGLTDDYAVLAQQRQQVDWIVPYARLSSGIVECLRWLSAARYATAVADDLARILEAIGGVRHDAGNSLTVVAGNLARLGRNPGVASDPLFIQVTNQVPRLTGDLDQLQNIYETYSSKQRTRKKLAE